MSPSRWVNWAETCSTSVALSYQGNACARKYAMNTPISLVLGFILIGAFTVDTLMYENENLVFLSKKFLDLIEWVAFWR
jgi:hypothetical protein